MSDSDEFTQLRKELVNPDNRLRYDAVIVLEQKGGPEAVQLLAGALRDPDYVSVRWRAARALGNLHAVAAVPDLVEALGDENSSVRKGAAQALGKIGSLDAVLPLIEALRDGERKVGLEASNAIRDIGPAAIPMLREAENGATLNMKAALEAVIGEIEDREKRRSGAG